MRSIPFIVAGLLFLALVELPIGYFIFLRIVVFSAAIILAVREKSNGVNFWVICFALVGILFNPIIPVHLQSKEVWAPIDVIAGILFLAKGFTWNNYNNNSNSQIKNIDS